MSFNISSTANLNVLGEALRDYAFIKHNEHDYGCYSTFDLLPEFVSVSDVAQREKYLKLLHGKKALKCDRDWCESVTEIFSDGDSITVAWYWDGDGTLLFEIDSKIIINDDCKKDNRWKDAKDFYHFV